MTSTDRILMSANPNIVSMQDALSHLRDHGLLYWEVKFPFDKRRYTFPLKCYIHISGRQVEYVATVEDVIPWDKGHYTNSKLAAEVKPTRWRYEWQHNINGIRGDRWKSVLVMSKIKSFKCDTYSLVMHDGRKVTHPPQGYIRLQPE